MRIMGLDLGSKTVGVAVSDPLGITAQGVEIIRRESEDKLRRTLARIETLAKEYQVEKFVLGYPKNMNNTIGERAQKSEAFKENDFSSPFSLKTVTNSTSGRAVRVFIILSV